MTHTAWIIPGMNPKIVKSIFSQNAGFMPTVKNTPNGGRIIAKIILSMLIVKFRLNLKFVLIQYIHF